MMTSGIALAYKIKYDGELLDKGGEIKIKIPKNVLDSIKEKIEDIAECADTYKHKYLKYGLKGYCKILWGGFRVIYSVDHITQSMNIHEIGPRGSVYD